MTYQHWLDGGHKRRLHFEEFPWPWTVGRLLLVPQHSFNHITQITRGLKSIVCVWIHSVQAKRQNQWSDDKGQKKRGGAVVACWVKKQTSVRRVTDSSPPAVATEVDWAWHRLHTLLPAVSQWQKVHFLSLTRVLLRRSSSSRVLSVGWYIWDRCWCIYREVRD